MMAQILAGKRRLGSIVLALACLSVAGAAGWSFFGHRPDSQAGIASGETTASIGMAEKSLGPSGLPIPRFVSLKAEKVNVRRGPSSDHAVAWVFQRKGLPVEIVAVISNRPQATGLEKAASAGIETLVINHKDYPEREQFDAALAAAIDAYAPDVIALAGFMRILTDGFVRRYILL